MLSKKILETIPMSIRIIRRLSAECLDGSISINHLRVLFLLKEGKGQSQIAALLYITQAAVSKMVTGLCQKGLVVRNPGADKRSLQVDLTPEGKKILDKVYKQLEKKINYGIDQLNQKEKSDLGNGLETLEKLMKFVSEA